MSFLISVKKWAKRVTEFCQQKMGLVPLLRMALIWRKCWLFRHTDFKKDSENRDREGMKHSPELQPFNLLKSRQQSDLIILEVSGGGGRVNAQKLTDVTVKERTRDSHRKLETERLASTRASKNRDNT